MNKNKAKIGEKLGRIFEIGFNIGILAYIEHNQFQHNFGNFYRGDLERIKLPSLVKRIARETTNPEETITSPESLKHLERWCQYFLQKGFLAGLNFFGEYINSTGWNDRRFPKPKEILYYQCSFRGDNSFGTYPNGDRYEETKALFSQLIAENKPGFLTGDLLNNNLRSYLTKYCKKGEFLQADTLMLLRCGKHLRIICVDLSVFSLREAESLVALDDIENIRKMLFKDIKHITSKSFFSKLRIDTGKGEDFGFNFSGELKNYFTAFKRGDKETTKLIQAGSYAYSFYRFLQQETEIITDGKNLVFNVVGYSDRNLSTISLRPENIDVLATCSDIYKNEPKDREIKAARKEVLKLIKFNASRSFKEGKKLIKELSEKPINISGSGIAEAFHTEKIEDFFNSIGTVPQELATRLDISQGLTLRDAHAELITKALLGEDTFVFLTGNPGIGKTTAIATFLKSHIEEGFLLLYVSPRKQVNIDLIEKFADKNGNLTSDKLFCINTNAIVIEENYGRQTVNYLSSLRQDKFRENNVDFLPIKTNPKIAKAITTKGRLERENKESIKDIGRRTAGVMNSICQGIYTAIDKEISNNIIATVSTQSLRVTPGGDTLKHLEKIFQGAYNNKTGVMPDKMRQISKRIKHVFIMVDEITGDDSGVNFLHGVKKFFKQYELTNSKHGFNAKIIVADASIVEPQVIQQHLSKTSPEPDKIYFRLAKSGAEPLSAERFSFGRKEGAIAINANSYPASSLKLTYKLFIQVERFEENKVKSSDNKLLKAVREQILAEINACLNDPEAGQLLVYIQNKRRLQQLIEQIQKQREEGFEENYDYLEIHANLSEGDKNKIKEYKQDVKVVFMTSSASRGLSFPKARRILVEIPRFQIERNLMEVIQVIYRARGEYWENGERKTLDGEEKEIVFYLGDRAIYYSENDGEEKQASIEESVLNLLDILVILKLSIMTRIEGAGRLGRKEFMTIPIGGKSVSAAGNTFSGEMTNLIRELKNEYRRNPKKLEIKLVYESFQEILKRGEFVLVNSVGGDNISYLSLLKSFNKEFPRICTGLDKLLDFGKIERGHITGNLLVVPIENQRLEETYEMRWEEQIRRVANNDELLRQMKRIINGKDYPENLGSGIKNVAMELIKLLRGEGIDRTQWFELNSENLDQYYAIPLFAFISGEVMREYFKEEPEEEEETEFRNLLSRYVHYLYPAYNTLPIGRKYRDFPFVIFRSYSLEQMRENVFSDRYLLTSNELNVLNLILSRGD